MNVILTGESITLNWQSDAQKDFYLYALAYQNAAKILSENVIYSNSIMDAVVCPIIFLYRHAVELYIKNIVFKCIGIFQAEDYCSYNQIERSYSCDKKDHMHHNIRKLFEVAKKMLTDLDIWKEVDYECKVEGCEDALCELDIIDLIEYLADLDNDSLRFRYSLEKDMKTSCLPKNFKINILNFLEKSSKLCDALDGCCCAVDCAWDNMCDYLSYLNDV